MGSYKSRAIRLAEAVERITSGKQDIEELMDELQNWLDNMPENLQQSEKAEQLDDAISLLQTTIEGIDDAVSEAESVEFPGMF